MILKNTLRKEIEKKLSNISFKENKTLSKELTENLISSNIWDKSDRIFIYLSFKNEVITDFIIEKALKDNKKVFAPLIDKNTMTFHRIDNINPIELVKNRFGILEPPKGLKTVIPESNDIMLIPGVGFSLKGERLGRGGGFYDRFLSCNSDIIKVGISFEVQIYNKIPTEEWDITLDFILTEKALYKTGEDNGNN